MYNMTEMNKLEQFLKNNGVVYDRGYHAGGEIIKVYDSADKHEVLWDAIINDLSYGRNDGLLEIYGNIVDKKEVGDSVEGWLTAEDVINRYEKTLGKKKVTPDVTIVLTAEEYETLKTGLHYGMNWLRNIALIGDTLDDDTLDAYSDILQAVWELNDKLNRKENRNA